MEFVTTELGSIEAGTRSKHLIYFQAAAGDWWFDRKLYDTVDEAWQAVHKRLHGCDLLRGGGDWHAIESISALRSGPALVNKTLSVYFPEKLLPINSQAHLRHFLRELGEPKADDQALGTTSLNRLLLEGLRSCPELQGGRPSRWSGFCTPRSLIPSRPTSNEANSRRRRLHRQDARGGRRRSTRASPRERGPGSQASRPIRRKDDPGARPIAVQAVQRRLRQGRRYETRFSPAFVGQTANALVGICDLFNSGPTASGTEPRKPQPPP